MLVRLVDWIGRFKDTWEALPWVSRLFWFFVGPGGIVIGAYIVELPVAGKIAFFVFFTTMWIWALYGLQLLRERRQKFSRSTATVGGHIRDISSRDEHTSAIRAQTEVLARQRREDERMAQARYEARQRLADFIIRARFIIDDLQDPDAAPDHERIGRWNNEVVAHLESSLGKEYVARFTEPAQLDLSNQPRGPSAHYRLGLQEKIKRLYQFVEELK